MKAILAMDMPECCAECTLVYYNRNGVYCVPANEYFDTENSEKSKPKWCPLKPMPEKKNAKMTAVPKDGLGGYMADIHIVSKNMGWNACIDAVSDDE